ncbi:MAG: TonB-dependent siderophore receptor [Candidatus Altimarinota bacterium]
MNLFKKRLLSPAVALLLYSSAMADDLTYSIEKQSLKDAIETISKKSNTPYIANSSFLDGKTSNAIKNIKGTKNALDKVLENSGLEAVMEDGAIIIKKKVVIGSGTVLEEISVTDGAYKSGSAENGYLVEETSNIGPWKGKSLQDTPISINVMSEELLENLQATSTDQIYNINPVMQVYWNQSQNNNGYVMLRGFSTTTSAFDGIRREKWQFTHSTNLEEYERLETITGLSGFLYGPASIGGIMNYIPKRPTAKAQNSITVGNAGGDSGYYTHLDSSGPLTLDGKVGYRLNIVSEDHDTHIENQHIERQMVNLAFDYKPTDNLLLQATISDSDYRLDGRQPYWYLASGATRPSASSIDSNKLWGQKWTYNETEARRYSTNFLWNIKDNIDFRAAYMKEYIEREGIYSSNTIQVDNTYEQTTTNAPINDDLNAYGFYTFLDFNFNTFNINHQLTLGIQKSDSYMNRSYYDSNNSNKIILNGLEFSQPKYNNEPLSAPLKSTSNDINHLTSTNFTIGDSIEFNSQWSLLIGASHVELEYKDTNYNKSAITPSISLVYKPIESLSLYSSYMESLEVGGKAGDTYGGFDVINAQAIMDPLMSEQIEMGAKLTLGDTLLTAALFEIDKGLEYYDLSDVTKPKYVQDGRQVHRGFEFTAMGKITDKLTTMAGFTLLDPQVKENKQNPLLEGKRPTNVADKFVKLYLEYTPIESMDLAFNTGLNYTGSFYGDTMNTDKMPSYTLVNIGTRYTTKEILEYPLTFRVNVNNLMDKEYWVNSNYLGDRRTIHASVQMKF